MPEHAFSIPLNDNTLDFAERYFLKHPNEFKLKRTVKGLYSKLSFIKVGPVIYRLGDVKATHTLARGENYRIKIAHSKQHYVAIKIVENVDQNSSQRLLEEASAHEDLGVGLPDVLFRTTLARGRKAYLVMDLRDYLLPNLTDIIQREPLSQAKRISLAISLLIELDDYHSGEKSKSGRSYVHGRFHIGDVRIKHYDCIVIDPTCAFDLTCESYVTDLISAKRVLYYPGSDSVSLFTRDEISHWPDPLSRLVDTQEVDTLPDSSSQNDTALFLAALLIKFKAGTLYEDDVVRLRNHKTLQKIIVTDYVYCRQTRRLYPSEPMVTRNEWLASLEDLTQHTPLVKRNEILSWANNIADHRQISDCVFHAQLMKEQWEVALQKNHSSQWISLLSHWMMCFRIIHETAIDLPLLLMGVQSFLNQFEKDSQPMLQLIDALPIARKGCCSAYGFFTVPKNTLFKKALEQFYNDLPIEQRRFCLNAPGKLKWVNVLPSCLEKECVYVYKKAGAYVCKTVDSKEYRFLQLTKWMVGHEQPTEQAENFIFIFALQCFKLACKTRPIEKLQAFLINAKTSDPEAVKMLANIKEKICSGTTDNVARPLANPLNPMNIRNTMR